MSVISQITEFLRRRATDRHDVTEEGQNLRDLVRIFRVPSRAAGAVPTFALLHGIGLSHREFSPMARVLSNAGEVISFDLPGFGASPHPRGRVTVEDHARLVARALDDRRVGPVVAVGHSMGAQFAIELAAQRPDLVSHVVLIGPVVDPARPTLRAQARALMRDWPLEPPQTQAMVVGDYLRCGFRWFLAQAIVMRDYPAHLRVLGVTQPMLVIRGAHDPIAKPAWVEWLAGQVRDGRVETIDGYRHNVAHSNAEATAAAIEGFLARFPE